jgi:hypothetical protein
MFLLAEEIVNTTLNWRDEPREAGAGRAQWSETASIRKATDCRSVCVI